MRYLFSLYIHILIKITEQARLEFKKKIYDELFVSFIRRVVKLFEDFLKT